MSGFWSWHGQSARRVDYQHCLGFVASSSFTSCCLFRRPRQRWYFLNQVFAREWATAGVRVNTLTPGFSPPQQNRALLYNEDGTPTERAKQILGHTPMERFGNSEELVGAAVFLASTKLPHLLPAPTFVSMAVSCRKPFNQFHSLTFL